MYKGDVKERIKYKSTLSKSRANWWKEGEIYTFVIDYLSNTQEIEFRIYIQSSVANMTHGWLSSQIKEEFEVNITILGIASANNVENYP